MNSSPTPLDERWVAALRRPGPAPDLDAAWAAVEQRSAAGPAPSPGRRLLPVAAAAAVLVLLVGVVAWRVAAAGDDEGVKAEQPPPSSTVAWERLPDLPIPPRARAATFAIGDEVFVVGGLSGTCLALACPPPEGGRQDGAALDVRTGTWRRIADAPERLMGQSVAVVAGAAYLSTVDERGDRTMLRYDPVADEWAALPPPPEADMAGFTLVAAGDRLVRYHGFPTSYPIAVFDPVAATWAELPEPPLPELAISTLVGADDTLLLIGQPEGPVAPSEALAMARLDLDAGRWRRLPMPDTLNESGPWLVDGERMVCADTPVGLVAPRVRADPVAPRCGLFDLATDTWTSLPDRPEGPVPAVGAIGVDGAAYVDGAVFGGVALDLRTMRWVEVPRLPAVEGEETTEHRPVVAVGRDLVAVGGTRTEGPLSSPTDGEVDQLADVWVWRAP